MKDYGYSASLYLSESDAYDAILAYINRHIDDLPNDGAMWGEIMLNYALILEPGVPKRTGALRKSVDIVPNDTHSNNPYMLTYSPIAVERKKNIGLVKNNYGGYQYDSPDRFSRLWKRHTPNTGGQWDKTLNAQQRTKLDGVIYREVVKSMNRKRSDVKPAPPPTPVTATHLVSVSALSGVNRKKRGKKTTWRKRQRS